MRKTLLTLVTVGFLSPFLMGMAAKPRPEPVEISFEPIMFEAADGTRVEADRGTFLVPENRGDVKSRQIKLSFVRFKSTSANPGAPIVYLAGGPGGSGVETARRWRFALFMAMREFGDVIAFDQRGTGASNDIPPCTSEDGFPLDKPLAVEAVVAQLKAEADRCAAFWKSEGIDLSGYNTLESAADIADLRRGLGASKISLWGISYGSHLAMAAIRAMPGEIDRVVLTGIEGPEATVKLPARTDRYFDRLQAAINQDAEAASAYPDLKGLMREVHASLEANPVSVTLASDEGDPVDLVIGKVDLQMLASFFIADPRNARHLPALYAGFKVGQTDRAASLIYSNLRKDPMTFRGMPEAMDIMSGISDARLALVRDEAKEALLGDLLNFPMPHMIGAFGLEALPESFREPVTTDVPTLVLSSTLDGRTYPEGAADALQGFGNLTLVRVVNGGHNVYMQDPVITEIIQKYMRGEEVPEEVTLLAPDFPH